MRRILALAVICLLGGLVTPTRAQVATGFSDPFFLYYGFYLPQQAYLASIPRQEDTLRQMAVQRQVSAITQRAGLLDPAGGLVGYDPMAAFADRASPVPRPLTRSGASNMNVNGLGPGGYYTRVSSYFPGHRDGLGSTNIPGPQVGPRVSPLGVVQSSFRGRGGRGMGGMGGTGMGMGGFR